MINLYNVTKVFPPNFKVLDNISLSIEAGEFVFLVGPSGAGKTTLIRLLTAEHKPLKGKIVVGGWDITKIKKSEIPFLRRQIGFVFQDFKLLPKKTVFENVAFALEVCGEDSKKIKTIVPQLLKIVGLAEKLNRYPRQLSGGEQQRVAIARALSHRPKLLIADEPTGDLDVLTAQEIVDLLVKINELGTTVLFVTHNRDVVNKMKKRVITLDNGQIIHDEKCGKYIL